MSGYYIELFDLISKKMNVEVKYILTDLNTWVSNLENGYIDIILGSSINEKRAELYSYNKHSIGLEDFVIYSNKNIHYINFDELNGLRFEYVEDSDKSEWIFNFFNAQFIPVASSGYLELEELINENKIDLMIDSTYKNTKYNKIYEFLGGQTYICTNNYNKKLLDEIDEAYINECDTFEDLVKEIDDYIDYHNNFKGQWNLKKMTPVQYRNHLLN